MKGVLWLTGQFPTLCLKARTYLPCVLSAAACVVIVWHQTALFTRCIRACPVPVALAECSAHTGREYARRRLRPNLCLTAQPLSPCETENYAIAELETLMWVALGIGIFLARLTDSGQPTLFPSDFILQLSTQEWSLRTCR